MTGTPAFDYADQQRIIDEMRAKDLFFVGGIPKSGTTWLQILLNAHPEVSCAGEGHFLTSLAPLLTNALNQHNVVIARTNHGVLQQFAVFPEFDRQNLRFLFVSAILLLMAASGKARDARIVGEKTPDNLLGFPVLSELLPAAKFIHILRDPRDCAVSTWFHIQRTEAKAAQNRFPTLGTMVAHIAQQWRDVVGFWERFAEASAARCALVRYEDLAARPQSELLRLFEFLRASTLPATIDDCVAAGDFARLSGGRPPGVEDRGSLLRQGLPGDWRNHFTQAEVVSCRQIAGGTMARYGYGD